MNEKIKQILDLAIYAPSGDNCQPWRFKVQSNQIDVCNIPERDTSLYSWGQRPSYIAHGALLENIIIVAPNFGYNPRIALFPDSCNSNVVARIAFEKIEPKRHPLYPFINERSTNRKPYKTTLLAEQQRAELSQIPKGMERSRILFVEKDNDKKNVALAAAGNEKILFENQGMHKFFYDHITWTEDEDREKKIGFYIKTFELPPPAEKMFKLAKNWKLLQVLNRIGFSKFIIKQNTKIYASCSAFGIITMPSNSPEDFILTGRLVQRTWLTATKLGLSIQPLTGILFLMQRILGREASQLSLSHQKFIEDQYKQIKKHFGVENETITMMFRIGDGGKPTAHALRLDPQISAPI